MLKKLKAKMKLGKAIKKPKIVNVEVSKQDSPIIVIKDLLPKSGETFRPSFYTFIDKDIPKDGPFNPYEKKLVENGYLTSVYNLGNGYVEIRVIYKTGQHTYYIPESFKLQKTTTLGKEQFEILEVNGSTLFRAFYSIGCDPEIFVENKDGLMPAFQFLGAKPAPSVMRDRLNLPVYWDGFQAEFETNPTGCLQEQCKEVTKGLAKLLQAAQKADPNAKLSIKTVMDIPQELLDKSKEEHVQFGCMPSFNAYGIEGHKRDGREVLYRPTGGHIHFGIGKQEPEVISRIVKTLDMIVGVACVSFFAKFDDPRRRLLYGLPGEYRLPKHGLEYRTLSNAWLMHPVAMHLVFDLARKALNIAYHNMFPVLNWTATEQETIDIITNCNVEAARKVLKDNKKGLLMLFKATYGNDEPALAAYTSFLNGAESIIADPQNVAKNWQLHRSDAVSHGINYQFNGQAAVVIMKGQKVA